MNIFTQNWSMNVTRSVLTNEPESIGTATRDQKALYKFKRSTSILYDPEWRYLHNRPNEFSRFTWFGISLREISRPRWISRRELFVKRIDLKTKRSGATLRRDILISPRSTRFPCDRSCSSWCHLDLPSLTFDREPQDTTINCPRHIHIHTILIGDGGIP